MINELRAWLDAQVITGDTIGDIRRQCFMPFESAWNGIVRDETARREVATEPIPSVVVCDCQSISNSGAVADRPSPAPLDYLQVEQMPVDELMEVARHQREIVWDAGLQDAAQAISDLMGVYERLKHAEAERDALRIALREFIARIDARIAQLKGDPFFHHPSCSHFVWILAGLEFTKRAWADTLGQILTEKA